MTNLSKISKLLVGQNEQGEHLLSD